MCLSWSGIGLDGVWNFCRDSDEYPVHASKIWKMRMHLLRMLMCRYKYYKEFEDVARLFQTEMRHNELVITDITAGLMLMSRKHHLEAERFFNEASNFAMEEQLTVKDAERVMYFYKFANAAYGWPNYIIEDRAHVIEICCACSCREDGYVNLISREGECACHYNSRTVINRAGISREDLIAISFQNTIHETPFYVCMDHESKNVIVAIRGTQSLADCLTDMIIHPEPIAWGYPDTFLGHKGMLAAANFVYTKIQRIGCFDYCYEKWPDYKLVVVGHSLGAGVAGLLAFILRSRDYLKKREVTCYTYAPPGILLSKEASDHSRSFCFSGVVERDIVPRFSLGALRRLERELSEVLYECKQNKSAIIFGSVAGCFAKLPCCRCLKKKEPDLKDSYFPGDKICESVDNCREDGHDCHAATGHQLVSDNCYCREDPADNSRANSYVIPHQFHDVAIQIDLEDDTGVITKEPRDQTSTRMGASTAFGSNTNSGAPSTSSGVTSKISEIIHRQEREREAFRYVPRRQKDDVQIGHTTPLYPPGIFLYFEPCHPTEDLTLLEKNGRRFTKLPHFLNYVRKWKEYQYFWIEREFFDRIFIADRMFTSHFPYTMDYAIVLGQPRIDILKPDKQDKKKLDISEDKAVKGTAGKRKSKDNFAEAFPKKASSSDLEETYDVPSEEYAENTNLDLKDQRQEKSAQTISISDLDMSNQYSRRLSDITERHEGTRLGWSTPYEESNIGSDKDAIKRKKQKRRWSQEKDNTHHRNSSSPINFDDRAEFSKSHIGDESGVTYKGGPIQKRRSSQLPREESVQDVTNRSPAKKTELTSSSTKITDKGNQKTDKGNQNTDKTSPTSQNRLRFSSSNGNTDRDKSPSNQVTDNPKWGQMLSSPNEAVDQGERSRGSNQLTTHRTSARSDDKGSSRRRVKVKRKKRSPGGSTSLQVRGSETNAKSEGRLSRRSATARESELSEKAFSK
ncbi:uncharacterized protein LOC134842030 isoform X3 [Symsagittifera roscoffensis]|uniref:uncharacterized protein LOC134842030 isoform X3 n=1 Tax=Symsagittifera roscoffensis TaxID=84072 RepID=UPI00307B7256